MKRFFIVFSAWLIAIGFAQAQVVQPDELAVVYYAPKNQIVLDFEYTKTVCEAGIYSAYAETLLGIHDAIGESNTSYELKNATFTTRTLADTTRVRKVVPETDFPSQLLTIDSRGLLVGYNIPYETPKKNTNKNENKSDIVYSPKVKPLTEEQLEVEEGEARAEAVAKQILRIRESRLFLLNGEVENPPADGRAMKLVLDELAQQEQALTELFIGTKTQHTEHHIVRFWPEEEQEFFFFSEENGFTSSENIDADTIFVNLTAHRQAYKPIVAPEEPIKKGKAEKKLVASQLIYNLPGSTEIQVVFNDRLLGSKTLPIAQFGIDVPLARDLFTGKTLPVIHFNTRTGNIESIAQ